MSVREFIARAPALSGAEPALLDRMAASASIRTFARGDHLWRAGDLPVYITLVRVGLIKVVRPATRGRSTICGLFGPPETVGDLAVLREIPYPADAIVATDTASVIGIPAGLLIEGSKKTPELALSVASAMHSKLSALHDKVDVLSAGSVEARMALLLIKLYERFGDDFDDGTASIPVAISRRELSELVSTSFETAIRVMTRWDREGVLQTTTRGFVIQRMARLAEVAGVEAPARS